MLLLSNTAKSKKVDFRFRHALAFSCHFDTRRGQNAQMTLSCVCCFV